VRPGNLAPLTVDSTAQVINNARADITLQAAVSVETEVIRAPSAQPESPKKSRATLSVTSDFSNSPHPS
jgi:hypothetical protein